MTVASPAPPDPPTLELDRRVIAAFARLSGGFWQGESATRAWTITLALVAFLSVSIAATLALNLWNKWFFDALAAKDGATLGRAVLVLGLIIAAMAAVGVGIVRSRETLQVRWREWVTRQLIERWLDRQRFYHLGLTRTEPANPEYRIADDTRWATELLVDCGIGFFLAIIGAATFFSILWSVGGTLRTSLAGVPVVIPAYMVLAALAYGIIASGLMLRVGKPLLGSVVAKNEAEGHFRFALMRIRENAESIALAGGANSEKSIAGGLYTTLVARWLGIVRQHGNLTWITNASGPLVPIFPLLIATPKYLSGELTLGEVTQLAGAFVQVQVAISWIVDNYNRIADWYASARRLIELTDAAEAIDVRIAAVAADAAPHLVMSAGADRALRLSALTVRDADGRMLVGPIDLSVKPGEHLTVSAPSGGGKTSLARAIGGLWPWGSGTIERPEAGTLLIIPQRPYVPTTTLRRALGMPTGQGANEESRHAAALHRVGLSALIPRLDETVRWDHALSNGDLQRLGIARVLIERPDLVILDEATSALDEAGRADLLRAIAEISPRTAVVSLTQQPPADRSATRHVALTLVRPATPGASAPPARIPQPV